MALSAGWKTVANDPFGEGITVRAYVRVDTAAGSDQLVELTATEKVISCEPIRRARERSPGVVQGQQWSLRLTNNLGTFTPGSAAYFTTQSVIEGEWIELQFSFEYAGVAETFASGPIEKAYLESDGSFTIFVESVMVADVMRWVLPRPLVYDERGDWSSPVYTVQAGQDEYDNTLGKTLSLNGLASWETFRISFVTTTSFHVTRENGTNQAGGPFPIGSNLDITSLYILQLPVVRIFASGWAGTYVTGDEFVVYTCPQVSSAYTNPLEGVRSIIDVSRQASPVFGSPTTVPAVIAGGTVSLYDDSAGAWTAALAQFSSVVVRGAWPKGTRGIDLIQGLLRLMNASIFPTRSGQIGISLIEPQGVGTSDVQVTGDPNAADASVLRARRYKDRDGWIARVIYKYRNLNFPTGQDGIDPEDNQPGSGTPTKFNLAEAIVDNSTSVTDLYLQEEIDLLWAIKATEVDAAASKYLNQRKQPNDTWEIDGTLTNLAVLDLNDALSLTEKTIGAQSAKALVREIDVDPLANETRVVAYHDPVVFANYARVGVSVVGGSDFVF